MGITTAISDECNLHAADARVASALDTELACNDCHGNHGAAPPGVEEGLALLVAVDGAGQAALANLRFRRGGLAISLVVILLFVAALGLTMRQLDRRAGLRRRG